MRTVHTRNNSTAPAVELYFHNQTVTNEPKGSCLVHDRTCAAKTMFLSAGLSRLLEEAKNHSHYAGIYGGRHKLLEKAVRMPSRRMWRVLGIHFRWLGEEATSLELAHFAAVCPLAYLREWAIVELQLRELKRSVERHSGDEPEFAITSGNSGERLFGTSHPSPTPRRLTAYGRTEAEKNTRQKRA